MNSPVHRGAFAHRIGRTRTFRAWRVAATGPAIPLDIGQPYTIGEALADAQLGTGLQHKETLLIHERDEARRTGRLRAYAIKQRSQPTYRKCEATGVAKAFRALYPDLQFSVSVFDFAPEQPFDAFRDDAVGIDRSLIQPRKETCRG